MRNRTKSRLGVMFSTAALVGVLLAALVATPVAAATFNVNVGCGSTRVAKLIRAIETANQRSQAHRTVIHLAAGCTYSLRSAYNSPPRGADGLPSIRRRVVIDGNGSEITRHPDAPRFRIFSVGTAGRLTLIQLTVSNGLARSGRNGSNAVDATGGAATAGSNGGGIHNKGTLILERVILTGNSAGNGGRGGSATGTPGVAGDWNAAGPGEDGASTPDITAGAGGDGGHGGAIYSTGTLEVRTSILSWNQAGHGGAGGAATTGDGGAGGQGSTQGGQGGDAGLATSGEPGEGGAGGAIYSSGTLSVSNTHLTDNAAGDGGTHGTATGGDGGDGGDGTAGPGGAGGAGGEATTVGTSIGGDGDAIYLAGGSATVDSSAFEDNSGGDGAGGPAHGGDGGDGGDGVGAGGSGGNGGSATSGNAQGGDGGGIVNDGASLSVTNSTFSNNQGGNASGGFAIGGNGGAGGSAI